MSEKTYELGLVGLGTMGKNLLLNMADNGFAVAGYDQDFEKVNALAKEGENHPIYAAATIHDFIENLKSPRAILLLVPAGKVVDAVIEELRPYLSEDDLIIDGGNSHFEDTDRRQKSLAEKGILLLGMGISGGAEGARKGPSMMPGGPKEAYERLSDLLEATAAKVGEDPCVAYLGTGAVGHYVKMVHNGIEYGLMQLIAETYDIMKRGLNLPNRELRKIYESWNQSELDSFLVEITADIFKHREEGADEDTIDLVLDKSKQKGTGKWTSQNAMDLGTPVPNIDAAVSMRIISGLKQERLAASRLLPGPDSVMQDVSMDAFLQYLKDTLYFAYIVTYAQGIAQLKVASQDYGYELNIKEVARIWRGGCIIRAALLEKIYQAFNQKADLSNLLLDDQFAELLLSRVDSVRRVIKAAIESGIPVPGMMAALAYFDAYRASRLPANLVQAQRDYFGAHTYERIDQEGTFHTDWK